MGPQLQLLLALLAAAAGEEASQAPPGCSVDLLGEDVPKTSPLLLKPGGSKDVNGFVTPASSGFMSLNPDEQIILACPNSTLHVTGQSQETATCAHGTTFSIRGHYHSFSTLTCSPQSEPSGQYTGERCGSNDQYKAVQLGFQVDPDFYKLIDACFDDRTYTAVYDNFTLLKEINGRQRGFTFDWLDGGFFPHIDVSYQYQVEMQIQTFGTLLGSVDLARSYIHETNNSFLAKGHLTNNSDFLLGAEGHAAYFYVNAAPRWQTLNQGNWKTLEDNVFSYAANNQVDLEIYTGTHGITTLPNVNLNETELYLYVHNDEKYIPVPKIFWKIVYNANTKAGTVFVAVNNPYIDRPGQDYNVCTDICSRIPWVKWDAADKLKGFAYCCEYADFKRAVPDAPNLIVHSPLS